jgi:hypothetical protein
VRAEKLMPPADDARTSFDRSQAYARRMRTAAKRLLPRRKDARYLSAAEEALREAGRRRISVEAGEANKAMSVQIKSFEC